MAYTIAACILSCAAVACSFAARHYARLAAFRYRQAAALYQAPRRR